MKAITEPLKLRRAQSRDRRGARHEEPNAGIADEQSENAPAHAEQKAFDEQLPNDAAARRTERAADGDLPASPGRARNEQVRDVGARNEQHETNCAEQHVQRLAHVADQRLGVWSRVDVVEARVRIFLCKPAFDLRQLVDRLLDRHATTHDTARRPARDRRDRWRAAPG